MRSPLVLVLDEATENHEFIKTSLEQAYGDEVEVNIEEPLNTKEQMIARIQSIGENLSALIFDERLYETGVCDYVGSELAEAYRSFDPKIPIYILTSFPDTVDSMSGDIEYVIDKSDLTEDSSIEKLSSKLRRHLNIFQDMVGVRKKRLDELLIKQVSSSLAADEVRELGELQFWRVRPVELEESLMTNELRASLDEKEKILSELEEKIKKES